MKKIIATICLSLFLGSALIAQEEGIQKGDKELGFFGMYQGSSDFSFGMANVSLGYYFTKKLLIGGAPTISVFGGGSMETTTTIGLQIFVNFNFVHNQRVIPYGRFSYNNADFSNEGTTYLQIGPGLKAYLSPKTAWDSQLTYGFGLGDASGGNILFTTGFSRLF